MNRGRRREYGRYYDVSWYHYFDVIVDNRQHKRPHIHAKYQDHEAVFAIPGGEVLDGGMPSNKTKLVLAWVEIHQEELMANWELATGGQPIFRIEPLR
jgi:hypothetical protein